MLTSCKCSLNIYIGEPKHLCIKSSVRTGRLETSNIINRASRISMENFEGSVFSKNARFTTLIFDLDGTLYPNNNGYVDHIRNNAEDYIHDTLGVPKENVSQVRKKALALANQTAIGLQMQGYEFDKNEFVEHMRAGAENFLTPDPEVQDLLYSLPQPKWIFTNTSEKAAREAMDLLGISRYFNGVFGADFMGEMCKPQPEVFHKVLQYLKLEADSVVMFEDSLKNINTCKQLGITTVFIRSDDPEQGFGEVTDSKAIDLADLVDVVIDKCSEDELRTHFPSLW